MGLWRPAGTPMSPAARTGSTPPWWCISTSRTRVAALHLGPLLTDAERRYLTCDATCEVWFERDGSSSAPGGRPGRSAAGCAAPWSTATPAAWSPVAVPPAVCTPTTFGTGRTAAPPNSPTWSWSAPTITGCTTAAASPSPARRPLVVTDSDRTTTQCGIAGPTTHRPPPACRPTPGRPANAPTGGGTNPSNPNHHQQTTRLVTGPVTTGL